MARTDVQRVDGGVGSQQCRRGFHNAMVGLVARSYVIRGVSARDTAAATALLASMKSWHDAKNYRTELALNFISK